MNKSNACLMTAVSFLAGAVAGCISGFIISPAKNGIRFDNLSLGNNSGNKKKACTYYYLDKNLVLRKKQAADIKKKEKNKCCKRKEKKNGLD